jgi:TolB protein
MVLHRVAAVGGPADVVDVARWDWGEPTARLRIRTRAAGADGALPARLSIRDVAGHPAIPSEGQPRFDMQNGRVFVYSPGVLELELPAGPATVMAARGLTTPVVVATPTLAAGQVVTVDLELREVWDAAAAGWTSGDHHFHLNYGGPFDLDPEDLVPQAAGENLDVATPLLANLHNRFEDQDLWGWTREQWPLVRFGHEVRSHFHGHVGLLGTSSFFWPWVWGPGYQVYGADDRGNVEPLQHARAEGGFNYYVHPVMGADPFAEENIGGLPVDIVADAVLGDLDGIELVCLWSDEIGTAELWYRFLNLGIPIVPTAGTDVMTDYYRTMAVGTTRVYARVDGPPDFDRYLDALKAGRTFATNGPMLDLRVRGAGPGEVVAASGGETPWTLVVRSAVPFEQVDVLVNGEVAWTGGGMSSPGERTFSGTLRLPAGGWIAARAVGGAIDGWPAMDSYAFGHTSPVWIGAVGSTEPAAERAAAADLLRALDVAEASMVEAYGDREIPVLRARFAEARAALRR